MTKMQLRRFLRIISIYRENRRKEKRMGIDLSRFKVIHGDKVLNAVALMEIRMPEGTWEDRETIIT